MAEQRTPQHQLNIKVSADELARVRAVQQRLEAIGRYGPHVRATTRLVLLEGLDLLEAYLTRLEKDKDRKR
jgi:hypothetical protein